MRYILFALLFFGCASTTSRHPVRPIDSATAVHTGYYFPEVRRNIGDVTVDTLKP
jgi:hypothetical protein